MSGLMMGMLLAALDQTIVSTALTTIGRDFHRLDLYGWVVTSYLLTSTATTPLYGKISDQFGRKRIFQAAIVIFLIGSALSGLSQSMYQLIIFRGVQGLGAGGLMTLALAIVGDVIPPRERGRYQGYFGAVFAVASVIGPLVGGFLVDAGLVAVGVLRQPARRGLRPGRDQPGAAARPRPPASVRIDILGSVLLVSGVSLFLVGGPDRRYRGSITHLGLGLRDPRVLLVVVFVWWETRAAEPIIPLHLFRNRVFTVTNVLAFITGSVMFGALIFLPQYFQRVRGISPTAVGPVAAADAGRNALDIDRFGTAHRPARPLQGLRGRGHRVARRGPGLMSRSSIDDRARGCYPACSSWSAPGSGCSCRP